MKPFASKGFFISISSNPDHTYAKQWSILMYSDVGNYRITTVMPHVYPTCHIIVVVCWNHAFFINTKNCLLVENDI